MSKHNIYLVLCFYRKPLIKKCQGQKQKKPANFDRFFILKQSVML